MYKTIIIFKLPGAFEEKWLMRPSKISLLAKASSFTVTQKEFLSNVLVWIFTQM